MKSLSRKSIQVILVSLIMLFFVQTRAQEGNAPMAIEDCQYTIENDVQVSPYELQFDLYLKDTDPSQPFEFNIAQGAILVSTSIIGGGTITCDVVHGYSEIKVQQRPDTAAYQAFNSDFFVLKMAPKGAYMFCDSATIISTEGLGTRINRLRIVNTVPFVANSQANLHFNFSNGLYPYYWSRIYEYISHSPCVGVEVPIDGTNSFPGPTYMNIHLISGPIGINDNSNSKISIYSHQKTVFINSNAGIRDAHVIVCNLLGKEILTQNLTDQQLNQVQVDAVSGYYIVKIQSDNTVKTAKIYIN